MLNAKETLKRLADALNITSEANQGAKEEIVAEATETTTEVVESETKEETETTEETPQVAEEVKEESVEEPQQEEVQAEVKEEPKVDDTRVQELEEKVKQLTEILKNAMAEPQEVKPPEVPEDSKGLTHSPEAPVRAQGTKIGNKGGDVMSRVFKYINH